MKPRLFIMILLLLPALVEPAFSAYERLDHAIDMDEAVRIALEKNRQVMASVEESRAAAAEEKVAFARFLPRVEAAYQYSRLIEEPFMYFNSYNVDPNSGIITGVKRVEVPTGTNDNFHWEVSVTQPLFTGFATSSAYGMAKTDREITKIREKRVSADIRRQVKKAYIRVLMSKRLADLAGTTKRTLAAHHQVAARFYEQGLIPYNDLLSARVELARAVQREMEAKSGFDIAFASFNTILSVDPDSRPELSDLPFKDYGIKPQKILVEKAYSSRPEIEEVLLLLKRTDQAIRLAKSSFYPSVFLKARYAQDGDDWRATENPHRNSYNSAVAVVAKWTLFEGNMSSARISALLRRKRALELRLEGLKQQVALEIRDALARIDTAGSNIRTAAAAQKEAEENLRITRLRYEQQISTSTEVLDAATRLEAAKTDYVKAVYGFHQARVDLERAVGDCQ